MGIRESLNNNPVVAAGATGLVILIAIIIIVRTQCSSSSPFGKPPTQFYFTVDDGATWFVDDAQNIPPFQKDGKTAVQVHLFACKGEAPQALYLEKQSDAGKAALEKMKAEPNSLAPLDNAPLVKRPKTNMPWQVVGDGGTERYINPGKCPDGTYQTEIWPGK